MSTSPRWTDRFAGWTRAHQRALVICWLVLCAGVVGAAVLDVARLGLSDRLITHMHNVWIHRVVAGEKLVVGAQRLASAHDPQAAARFAEATAYLQELDRTFPARSPKHRMDEEEERLLTALGEACEGNHDDVGARAAFERLAAFDPRNFHNPMALAQHHLRAGRRDLALLALKKTLTVNPNHLPAVEAAMTLHFDALQLQDVVATWSAYVHATAYAELEFECVKRVAIIPVPVDGAFHDVVVPISVTPGDGARLVIRSRRYAFQIGDTVLTAPLRMGTLPNGDLDEVVGPAGWVGEHMRAVRPGVFDPANDDALIRLNLTPRHDGVHHVRFRLRCMKPANDAVWAMLEASFRGLRDDAGLAAFRSLTLPPGEDAR